jgi:hypothetical protein
MMKLKLNKCEFFDVEKAANNSNETVLIKIGKPIIEPKNVLWNLTHSLCVCIYEDFCVIIKNNKDGLFTFFKTVNNLCVLNGYFIENLFFYVTDDSVGVLISDFSNEIIDIKLAKLQQGIL